MDSSRPIGVFDSGLGGISVVRAIMDLLPAENLIYFGDTARVPYGSKSAETVIRFSRQIAHFLLERDIKLLVVACNTASATALATLRKELDIPVIGVIEPGAQASLKHTRNRRIGVIGTTSTIRSEAYSQNIHATDPRTLVLSQACPLLVPLVEEDWQQEEVIDPVLNHYLAPFKDAGTDTLILGCTHYPYLKDAIQAVMGTNVALIDSGEETARVVKDVLAESGRLYQGEQRGEKHHFYVSDFPQMFRETASRFLGKPLENLFQVELEVLEALIKPA